MTFEELVSPFDRRRFLKEIYQKDPLQVLGEDDKFSGIFSWAELNDLLAQSTLWTENSLELAGGGRTIPAQEYCLQAQDREGRPVLRPDVRRLKAWLRRGASATVNFIDLTTPGLRAMTQCLEAVFAAQTTVTAFLSWHNTQGYPMHFDLQNVFALQISGTKTWRVYEGIFPNPADYPGARHRDISPADKKRMAGRVLQQFEMSPGDLLYIPAGQFHEALSTSEASLHVSFGVCHLVAADLLNIMLRDLTRAPEFREALPDPSDQQAQGDFARRLSGLLQSLLCQPDTLAQIQALQRDRAFGRVSDFSLPDRSEARRYRVLWRDKHLTRTSVGWTLHDKDAAQELSAEEGGLADHLLRRDFIEEAQFVAGIDDALPPVAEAMKERMVRLGILAPI